MSKTEQAITMWTEGDYSVVESWIASASRAVLDPLDFEGQPTMLDVACGMGTVAIEAARRGATVTGVDLTPKMLDEARRRADRAGVTVRWVEGSFDALAPLGSFDIVTSAFGVIFAADPKAVAEQLASVSRPGGRIVLTSWHDDGAFGGGVMDVIREITPGLPEGPAPERWSNAEALSTFFRETAVELKDQQHREILLPFRSVTDAFREFLRHSGPWMQLMAYMDSVGKADQARAAFEDYLTSHATPNDDGIRLRVSYVVSALERR
ncbi:MAG: class I SAM-dependent methyltransferase [Myxococcota bacterium]